MSFPWSRSSEGEAKIPWGVNKYKIIPAVSGDCFIIPETKDFSLSSPLGPGGKVLLSLHNYGCAFTGWSDRGIERIVMSSDTRVEVGGRQG